jgi:hypothetical protein
MGNNPKLLSQIRLDNQCLNDDSFLYIACNGHSDQFVRLFHTKALVNITVKAKDEAFVAIIENGHSPEMIYLLLNEGFVNATLSVNDGLNPRSTALHWACSNGYSDIVMLLLKYDNVDVCSKDHYDNEPIHYAAEFGRTESYFL